MITNVELNFPIITVKDFGRRPTPASDISALLYLMDKCKNNFLEIGCWYGKTTHEIAIRHPNKIIYTMDYLGNDLKLDLNINRGLIQDKEDLCKYAKDLPNVKFLYVNSKIYDFNILEDIDFIFIDGDHSFDGIKSDTEKAIEYLKKRYGGTIAWHDIRVGHTEVPKYMKYLSESTDITYIKNTNIGFIVVQKQ